MPAGEGRARRRTAKVVNYAKEQEFSDVDDIFEDDHDREERLERQQQREQNRRNKRKSNAAAAAAPQQSSSSMTTTMDPDPTTTTAAADAAMDSDFADEGPPKPIHVEKGYDPGLLPIRERFDFMPEFEPDGSPKIELIVGRRPREEKKTDLPGGNDDDDDDEANEEDNPPSEDEQDDDEEEEEEEDSDEEDEDSGRRGSRRASRRSRRSSSAIKKKKGKKKKGGNKTSSSQEGDSSGGGSSSPEHLVEYEYLVKYKGRSYLHLEWKSGADLESMNKSAKTLYRRFLKKLSQGTEEDLEDPDFDPSYAQPQKIVDEAEKETTIELSDKELVEWEKEREEELALEEEEEEEAEREEQEKKEKEETKTADGTTTNGEEKSDKDGSAMDVDEDDEDAANVDMSTYTIEKIRKLIQKDGPYYPVYKDCDNPYRDGYITTPPKKPRPSYLFYQGCMRSKFQRKFPNATTGEIMTMLGDTWRTMTEEQQYPFITLAKEEQEQFEKERQMMEKAQKPSEMWQPLRRCLQVLDRLAADGFANIFLEPVDLADFPDYEEIVDTPMDLGTVRTKLETRKYQAPENFARDVRKIWNNCKIYNQHGSAIWHVADYMSKQFERLYHAWVLEYRERYLRWVNPKARPWEHTCRQHDGSCGTPDDKMIVCDHCDAMYGMSCLSPPLMKLPKGIWHCPDCKPKLASVKGVRMLSAVSEQAARKRAELGDTPKKRIKQKMYLVKWAGLGYEFCTWESREDVDDDALIAEYQRLNNTTPDEPDVPEDEISKVFEKTKHLNTAGVMDLGVQQQQSRVRALKNQLYAQTRGLQFSRFGMDVPQLLSNECGPKTKATAMIPSTPDLCSVCSSTSSTTDDDDLVKTTTRITTKVADVKGATDDQKVKVDDVVSSGDISTGLTSTTSTAKKTDHPKEVVECVTDMVFRLSRNPGAYARHIMKINKSLPPLLTGEYDAAVPITSKGLMMNVGEIHGSVAFLGYRTFPDGSKGPAEVNKLIRNVGDKIIAVDGVSTIDKSFKEVINLLRESGKNKVAFMRFLENKYSVCMSDLTSVGNTGRYTVEELQKKFSTDRQRLLVQRRQQMVEEEYQNNLEEESDGSVGPGNSSDEDESDEEVSEGEFDAEDSDDEDLLPKMGNEKLDLPPPVEEPPNATDDEDEESSSAGAKDGTSSPLDGAVPASDGEGNASGTLTEKVSPPGGAEGPKADETGNDQEKVATENGENLTEGEKDITKTADTETESESPGDVVVSEKAIIIRPETTRSLAFRLLDIDLGYSSDEGGDEDCAYFLDGVDDTFTTMNEVEKMFAKASPKEEDDPVLKSSKTKSPKGKGKASSNESDKKESSTDEEKTVPVKRNDFSTLGDGGKLSVAVSMSSNEPKAEDFDKFPFPSSKEEAKKKAELEAIEAEKAANSASMAAKADPSQPEKPVKRSTVKVEQINTNTGEIIRIWASAEDAAATLQISLPEIKQMLKGDYDEDLGDEVGGYRWRYAVAGAEVTATAGGSSSKGSKKGKEAFLEFRDKLYDHNAPHDYKNGNKLRDYQIDGVNWLASTWYKKHSCILADEMGLGKTVQIVSYIEHLFRVEKIHRPYLVVVPLSTVEHWRREFQGWTDMVCCVYHDRQRVWRDVMREYEWYYADRPHNADYLKFDVLVTTYDTLIGDFDIIGQIPWRVAVVDEAHRLRNVKGKLLECMKEISALGTLHYGFQSRVLMTGTPLQNDTQELWTLLNFIEPYKFPSLEEFQTNFGNMANREQVEALQRKISPYMLRRVKEDVAKDIPAKEETVIDVELTSIQKQYYRAIFEHNHSFLSMGATRANAPKLMNIQMELRKCCNHPFLLDGVEQRETDKHFKELIENGMFDSSNAEEQQLKLNEHGYIQTSGKMVLLDKLLPKLRQEGHKVLIFSQMVKMLDLISEYCDFRNFRHERLDGRVRGTERQKAIDRFENEEDSFVFLLSTRAGGVGINLTAADICIIFDSDWNPQNDVQAQARCHRIGQTKDVMVYRLITSRTFEQEMFDRASKKLGLEQAILGTFGQEDDNDKPTSKEMEQLLKKGAYALLEDENDEMGKEFCSDNIEDILAKRTRTRVVEGAKTATWLNKQGMVVSKSKFTGDSAAATANVDVDDPMFWQKVMPDFVTPQIMMTKLDELGQLVTGPASGKRPGRKKKVQPASEIKTEGSKEGEVKDAENDPKEKDDTNEEDKKDDPLLKDEKSDNKENPDTNGESKDANRNESKEKENDPNEKENQTVITSAEQLTRTAQRKVGKFMADLKSMMDGIFEEAEDDSLPASEKATCQKLLLTISIKESLFNEEQRHIARVMLKKLEGDRRRRCRVTGDKPVRKKRSDAGSRAADDDGSNIVREELLILSKHQQKKRRQKPSKGRRKGSDDDLDEDGYLRHSDSEGDWSDVGEDIYKPKVQRLCISRKEAKRRRAWASDKDAATAAGRPWPAFPRNVVSKVLSTVLDEVIKYDAAKGGIFSVPVPKDEFPEYYEQIKTPMDYGTMKRKLENGEYRSAQSMQKDFVLVMSNCLQFNSPDSDIVQEVRQQALMRPGILREAAMKNNLFLAEDGSVLEVTDEADVAAKKEGTTTEKKKRRKRKTKHDENDEETPKKRKRRRKRESDAEATDSDSAGEEDARGADDDNDGGIKKPRIKISLASSVADVEDSAVDDDDDVKPKKRKVKKRKRVKRDGDEPNDDLDDEEPKLKIRRKRRKKEGKDDDGKSEKVKRKKKVKIAISKSIDDKIDDDEKDAGGESDVSETVPSSSREANKPAAEPEREKEEDPSNVWLDVNLFKTERKGVDDSVPSARENFSKRGPWQFPAALGGKRYKDVMTQTINKIDRLDHYSLFAEEVTEDEAPGYLDIVKNPMDFGTIRQKIENGEYGNASSAAAAFYEDFLLVFDNCILYNDDGGEVAEEAARLFRHLPEIFASACSSVIGKRKNPKVRS